MFPGMNINPKMMKQAMKKMGMKQEEIYAKEVIIRLEDKELVFQNPSVSKVNAMGQETFQVAGSFEERSIDTEPEISKDDIKVVVEQCGCSEEEAMNAIREAEGDLAKAIMNLKN